VERASQSRGPQLLREQDVALDVVPSTWRPYVVSSAGAVDRRAYTMCVLDRLLHGLLRRDIYIAKSKHWGETRAQLLQQDEWASARPKVCRMLSLSVTAEPFIALLRGELDESYRRTAARLDANPYLRSEGDGQKDGIVLTPRTGNQSAGGTSGNVHPGLVGSAPSARSNGQ
jgi:hypothetical protein